VYRPDLNWNSLHSTLGYDVVTVQADDQGLVLPVINNMTYDLVRVRVCGGGGWGLGVGVPARAGYVVAVPLCAAR
jgi:hypothetical protein